MQIQNLFVATTPLQYLMARLIIRAHLPNLSSILLYREQHEYGNAFRVIDEAIGAPHCPVLEYSENIHWQLGSIERLFISNRFSPLQILLSYRIRYRTLCAFEDGIAFYMPTHPYSPSSKDGDWLTHTKNFTKLIAQLLHIRSRYQPSFFPFSRFQEIYSVYPWVSHARAGASMFSIGSEFANLKAPAGNEGQGTCVLLSQALIINGVVNAEYYMNYLRDRIVELRDAYQKVYFKPHPRDPSIIQEGLQDCGLAELLPEKYRHPPVELYIARYPRTAIYGFSSSTLSYANLFGAESWSFSKHFCEKTPQGIEFHSLLNKASPLLERSGVKWYFR